MISRRPTTSSTASISDVRPQSAQLETPNFDPAVAQAWLALTAGQKPSSAENGGEDDQIPTLLPVRYIPGSDAAEFLPARKRDRAEETNAPATVPASQMPPVVEGPSNTTSSYANGRRSFDLPEVVQGSEDQAAACNKQSPAEQEFQYARRNATLLAGQIHTPVTADPSNGTKDSLDEVTADSDNGEQQAASLKSEVAQVGASGNKAGKRKSRFARLRRLFGSGEKRERTFLPSLRRSFSIKSTRPGLCFFPSSSPSPIRQATRARARSMTVTAAYDGAGSPRSAISSGHLNKPLPLSPADRSHTSLSRAQSYSHSHTRSSNCPPLTASTTSTQATWTSSKEQFRQATRALLQADEMTNAPGLPMNDDGARSPARHLEPHKFDQGRDS